MKILFAHLYDAKFKFGGAERVLWDIACAIKNRFGESVACAVNPGDLADTMRSFGIPIYPLAWSKLGTGKTLSGLNQAFSHFQPDIVHSHHRYTTFLLDLFFKKRSRILHTEHVLRKDKRWLFRYGHQATAVHETVSQNLIDYFHVPKNRVLTIPNAVSVPPPNAEKVNLLKQKIHYQPGTLYALCIGRFETQKGHTYLVDAVAKLHPEAKKRLKILCAGEGTLLQGIRDRVTKENLETSFEFLGHIQEISELLALCDFLVLPSLWEGMPLSILEAYSAEKAALATDIPGSKEIVIPGKTGELVPVKDGTKLAEALERWLAQPEKIKAMGLTAKRWADTEFSYDMMTSRYHGLYTKLIQEIQL